MKVEDNRMNEMFNVGKIVNTHGVKGELKVMPTTDDPTRFERLKEVYVERKKLETYEIQSVRYHKGMVLLKFKGIEDMTAAELLKGAILKIDRKDSLPLEEDEYYIADLYGMQVYTVDEERYLGEIVDVIYTGSNDVYAIRKEGRIKDLLLPAIKQVVKKVNLSENKMHVVLLEGLEELCE